MVEIVMFWEIFYSDVEAYVKGDSLIIPRQEPDGDLFFVEGNGVYTRTGSQNPKIILNYKVSDESQSPFLYDICTNTIYSKQIVHDDQLYW